MPTPFPDSLAKAAYDAYCTHRHWKSFTGDALPQFDALPEAIKDGWRHAAAAVESVKHAEETLKAVNQVP